MTEQPDLKARLRRAAAICPWRAGQPAPMLNEAADRITDLEAERDEALKLLLTRYVSGDLVRMVTHALTDIARSSETICRLRGETDADEDLKRFVQYVDHTMNMSSGAVSEIIDFAQGQMVRAKAAESRLALADRLAEAGKPFAEALAAHNADVLSWPKSAMMCHLQDGPQWQRTRRSHSASGQGGTT